MSTQNIKTLGELKASGYQSKSVKDELRTNLITKIKTGKPTFEGVHGFENTVIPELERAILSRHNINFLGLRGQAKTRLARKMVELLDEYIPFVAGSEINDDPLRPISRFSQDLIAEKGDDTPISWLHRSDRFSEKLATPDVTVADLIGDVDPIKAANLKLSYADDRVIHFGMIPRANRCIFVINELPDLQARIQVALFNILQEGDIQIRGFKLRMPLDIQFIFTANPEDYTNRGSIVTPLKDRIGSQILTHYPETVQIARTITEQEAKLDATQLSRVQVPSLAKDLLEQIGFEARDSEYVDYKSGVSARMSITAYENLLSTAERRALLNAEEETTVRLSDFMGVIPAITGKVELVYEGEQEGAAFVAQHLLGAAIQTLFPLYFPKIEKLEKPNEKTTYTDLIEWFFAESGFELLDDTTGDDYKNILNAIVPLEILIKKYQPELAAEDHLFMKEFILWAMVEYKKLSKDRIATGYQFKDIYGSYISKL
ncbi:sigma 54-interacting transcriptional regulator [Flavobacterium algicola]|uniref:sigma 54-interacting transcriptional regulator n=1 Tax=Flavobacterium algicola TaxID=556529 RepID=UPI001EFC6AC0|nr:sigma 54-interacting transcriptional regulator [Flavobacterium algicola]MCG9793595.1 sigma 54-interacting transcriptional regulator [Flavobacterium algicola]